MRCFGGQSLVNRSGLLVQSLYSRAFGGQPGNPPEKSLFRQRTAAARSRAGEGPGRCPTPMAGRERERRATERASKGSNPLARSPGERKKERARGICSKGGNPLAHNPAERKKGICSHFGSSSECSSPEPPQREGQPGRSLERGSRAILLKGEFAELRALANKALLRVIGGSGARGDHCADLSGHRQTSPPGGSASLPHYFSLALLDSRYAGRGTLFIYLSVILAGTQRPQTSWGQQWQGTAAAGAGGMTCPRRRSMTPPHRLREPTKQTWTAPGNRWEAHLLNTPDKLKARQRDCQTALAWKNMLGDQE